MAKRPGSGSGIGVNYRPPGYRAVARRVDIEALDGGSAKPQQKKSAVTANPPMQPAHSETEAFDKAASPGAAKRGDKPE